jgi:hypothetical protein
MDISLKGACNNDYNFTFSKADGEVFENALMDLACCRTKEQRVSLQGIIISLVLEALKTLMWLLVLKHSMTT